MTEEIILDQQTTTHMKAASDAGQAFAKAIEAGRLSDDQAAANYAGHYMFMGYQGGTGKALFKHVKAFVRMRDLMASNKDLAARVEKLEDGHGRTVSVIEVLVEDIDRIAREVEHIRAEPPSTKRRIGFILDEE